MNERAAWQAKALVGLGVVLMVPGGAILLWMLDSVFVAEGWYDWGAAVLAGWWLANIVLGGFLLWQWVRCVWSKPLTMATPRLWRVSALYMGYLAAIIVFYFAVDLRSQSCEHLLMEDVVTLLPACLMLPLSGFGLATALWRQAACI